MATIIDTGRVNTVVTVRQNTVASVREVVKPVRVSSPGVQGRPGVPGPAGAGFTWEQLAASDVWTIPHNLGYRPAVDLFDSGGQEFQAEVTHLNENTVVVNLVTPLAGFARLN